MRVAVFVMYIFRQHPLPGIFVHKFSLTIDANKKFLCCPQDSVLSFKKRP